MLDLVLDLILAAAMLVGAYSVGRMLGKLEKREEQAPLMEKLWRYKTAIRDLDDWCGHGSPHARLIARHLKAIGEGNIINGGTPVADEACNISGLREQLRRVDAIRARSGAQDEGRTG